MIQGPENPFDGYQTPSTLQEILSDSGRRAILDFKLELLAENTANNLLNAPNAGEIIDGRPFSVRVNYPALGAYRPHDMPLSELKVFIENAAWLGVEAALEEWEVEAERNYVLRMSEGKKPGELKVLFVPVEEDLEEE